MTRRDAGDRADTGTSGSSATITASSPAKTTIGSISTIVPTATSSGRSTRRDSAPSPRRSTCSRSPTLTHTNSKQARPTRSPCRPTCPWSSSGRWSSTTSRGSPSSAARSSGPASHHSISRTCRRAATAASPCTSGRNRGAAENTTRFRQRASAPFDRALLWPHRRVLEPHLADARRRTRRLTGGARSGSTHADATHVLKASSTPEDRNRMDGTAKGRETPLNNGHSRSTTVTRMAQSSRKRSAGISRSDLIRCTNVAASKPSTIR